MDQDILYDYKATLDTSVTRKSSVVSILSSNPVDMNYNTELEAPGSISSPKESTDAVTYSAVQHQRSFPKFCMTFHNIQMS